MCKRELNILVRCLLPIAFSFTINMRKDLDLIFTVLKIFRDSEVS